jgi:hypothetical protein
MGLPEDVDALHALVAELEHKALPTAQAPPPAPPPSPLPMPVADAQPVAPLHMVEQQPTSNTVSVLQTLTQYLPWEHQQLANQVLYWISCGWKSALLAAVVALGAGIWTGTIKLPAYFTSSCTTATQALSIQGNQHAPTAQAPAVSPTVSPTPQ